MCGEEVARYGGALRWGVVGCSAGAPPDATYKVSQAINIPYVATGTSLDAHLSLHVEVLTSTVATTFGYTAKSRVPRRLCIL